MGHPDPAVELARHYLRFCASERLLLTGHPHPAWPDVAFEAQELRGDLLRLGPASYLRADRLLGSVAALGDLPGG